MALHVTHALAADELTTLRTHPQRSLVYLAVWPQFGAGALPNATVCTAQVDIDPPDDDRLYQVHYAGAADFADTVADQTVYVGTTPGGHEKGMVRLRVALGAAGGWMQVGETSDIDWAVGDYLTVVDEIGLWCRHVYIDGAGVVYMDRTVDYVDQHRYPDPIPVLQSTAALWLPAGGTVDYYADASDSWAPDGGALTYAWTAPTASVTARMNTDTPIITFDAPGVHRVEFAVTRNYPPARTSTAYRWVHVFGGEYQPVVKFELLDCSGDRSTGGWSFRVKMWDEATLDDIVDRARIVLFARDWYGDDEISIGPTYTDSYPGVDRQYLRANVIAEGWIDAQSIVFNNEEGTVTFDVRGPHFWLDAMPGFPSGLEDYPGNPTTWYEMNDLTVDRGLWHWYRWRTTAPRMMDTYITGDTRQIAVFDAPVGSLWAQLRTVLNQTILANPVCDRYSRLIPHVPVNLQFLADRVGIPVVQTVSRSDWRDKIDIERRPTSQMSIVDASGVGYLDAVADAYFSLAPGHVFKRYGSIARKERLALYRDQVLNNRLASLMLENANNLYPRVSHRLSGNYRVSDITPRQYLVQDIDPTETKRGIYWLDNRLIPTFVAFNYTAGAFLTDVNSEGQTGEGLYATGDTPPTPPTPPPPPPPPPPPSPWIPPAPHHGVIVWSQDKLARSWDFYDEPPATPTWEDITPAGINMVHRLVLDEGGSGAWLLTGENVDISISAVDGVFHTPDIRATPVVWTLVLSQLTASVMAAAVTTFPMGGVAWHQMASLTSFGGSSLCAGERKWNNILGHPGSATFKTVDDGAHWQCSDYMHWGVPPNDCRFWLHQRDWRSTGQLFYDGTRIWATGYSGHWWVPACPGLPTYATSTDGGMTWVYTPVVTIGAIDGFRNIGYATGNVYANRENDGSLYLLPDTPVDAPLSIEGGFSVNHQTSLYGKYNDNLTPWIGLWRDGAQLVTEGVIFAGADTADMGGVACRPDEDEDRVVVVNGGLTANPPVVVLYRGGAILDKTGNLLIVVGAWQGHHIGMGAATWDNAAPLVFEY